MKPRDPTLFALAGLALASCASEPLYLTTTAPPVTPDHRPITSDYVLITPYYDEVATVLAVAITKSAPQKSGSSGDPTQASGPVLTVTAVAQPLRRSYIYLHRNALYNDSVSISTATDGLLSTSNSNSQQQVTAILTELAQTAGAANPFVAEIKLARPVAPAAQDVATVSDGDVRQLCSEAVTQLLHDTPFYQTIPYAGSTVIALGRPVEVDRQFTADKNGAKPPDEKFEVSLSLALERPPGSVAADTAPVFTGIAVYYPSPTRVTFRCAVDGKGPAIDLSPPMVLNVYADREIFVPQRAFATSPQDNLTLSEGFFVGHTYSDVSAAKTVVDTVTAPIRALLPSVTVTTQTQVQTGGGKPDQTTTQVQQSMGPPKTASGN